MRNRFLIQLLIVVFVTLMSSTNSFAADVLHRLTHNDQYSLVLVSVTSAKEDTLELKVTKVISGEQVPSNLKVQVNTKLDVREGENLVISLDQKLTSFVVKWGAFKVSSGDYSTLRVMKGPLSPDEKAAFQRYINSDGKDKEFYFDGDKEGTKVFVKNPDGAYIQIFPETNTIITKEFSINNSEKMAGNTVGWKYLNAAIFTLAVVGVLFVVHEARKK